MKLGPRFERAVRQAGGRVESTRNGHLKVWGPKGFAIVGPRSTKGRGLLNMLADVERHAGLVIDFEA